MAVGYSSAWSYFLRDWAQFLLGPHLHGIDEGLFFLVTGVHVLVS